MKYSAWVAIGVAVLLALMGSTYVVREGQVAMVLNLGRVARTGIDPACTSSGRWWKPRWCSTSACRCWTPSRSAT